MRPQLLGCFKFRRVNVNASDQFPTPGYLNRHHPDAPGTNDDHLICRVQLAQLAGQRHRLSAPNRHGGCQRVRHSSFVEQVATVGYRFVWRNHLQPQCGPAGYGMLFCMTPRIHRAYPWVDDPTVSQQHPAHPARLQPLPRKLHDQLCPSRPTFSILPPPSSNPPSWRCISEWQTPQATSLSAPLSRWAQGFLIQPPVTGHPALGLIRQHYARLLSLSHSANVLHLLLPAVQAAVRVASTARRSVRNSQICHHIF